MEVSGRDEVSTRSPITCTSVTTSFRPSPPGPAVTSVGPEGRSGRTGDGRGEVRSPTTGGGPCTNPSLILRFSRRSSVSLLSNLAEGIVPTESPGVPQVKDPVYSSYPGSEGILLKSHNVYVVLYRGGKPLTEYWDGTLSFPFFVSLSPAHPHLTPPLSFM